MLETDLNKQEVKGTVLNPLPVALVGTQVNGKPNFLIIGYISPFNFGRHIFFSLYKKRFSRKGIYENKTFSVNIPSVDLLTKVNICGTKSGSKFDKSTLFEVFYGELKTAPMIQQCPLNMECEVVEILDYDPNEGIIGKVIKSYANSGCLTGKTLDLRKVDPIIWATGGDFNYYRLGDRLEVPEL
ncbi:MAG: flavin reductase family protein [Promethearchaeota archaeon]